MSQQGTPTTCACTFAPNRRNCSTPELLYGLSLSFSTHPDGLIARRKTPAIATLVNLYCALVRTLTAGADASTWALVGTRFCSMAANLAVKIVLWSGMISEGTS